MSEKQLPTNVSNIDLKLGDGITATVVIGGIQEIIFKKDDKTLCLSKDDMSLEVKEDILNFVDGVVSEIKSCDYLTNFMNEKFNELSEADSRFLNYLSLYFSIKEGTTNNLDTRNQPYITFCFFADSLKEVESYFYSFIDSMLVTLKYEMLEGMPQGSGNKVCEIRLPPALVITKEKKYKLRFRASFYRE